MPDRLPLAWLNGRTIPYSAAAVPVWDLGVVAGATISEMARTYRHRPFRIQNHTARLFRSCQELGFPLPYSESELAGAATALVEENTRSLSNIDDLGIVWFVTAGANPTYMTTTASSEPTVAVHTFRLPFQKWRDGIRSGVQLTIPDQRQLPGHSFPVQHKIRNRLHWWLADRAAAEIRPGSRALLVDAAGRMTETSTACFYAVIDDTVLTARTDVLRSTTRDLVRELCDRIGIRFRLTEISSERIGEFQEAFLSSTPCGLLPVASIDDHQLPGPAGIVVQQLHAEWTRVTGVDTFQQALHNV
ncbi:MAG: aminotransferase class IV [Planctomycetaceae bacterium]